MERPAALDKLTAIILDNESRAAQVARLLHDGAGQTLTAIGFHLHALGVGKEATREIQDHLEQVIESLRIACNSLQSNVVERSGLPLALELLVEKFRETYSMAVDLRIIAPARVASPIGHAAYRIAELALDNVRQHAPLAATKITFVSNPNSFLLEIADNGPGFQYTHMRVCPPGTGILLMEAYAGASNLHLGIASIPGKGTIVKIQTI